MPANVTAKPGRLRRFLDSDIGWSFCRTPAAWLSTLVLVLLIATAFLAPLIAPQNPHDLAQVFIDKAEIPPIWQASGEWPFLLGTDPQGRDVLSAILYGTRVSLLIGIAAVIVSMGLGVTVGLVSGFYGGRIDNLLMRLGDTVLSIPTLLMAILVSAIFRELLPPGLREPFAAAVLVVSISLTNWVQYARTVRASTMVERRKEYVLAARIIKVAPARIMRRHILPNTLTPVMVAATLNLGLAILSEATLSFLGVGMPITQPSLGTLIRIGNQYLFSGSWWLVVFPSLQLGLIVLSVNLLGDWLRDALNPKLR
ncbi:ABC-type dipeptide/oligopeptide/nickel transport system, permease component [Bosea sp. LC85]|uniref:ABC transporter permease n=1 Tax=Bosea sp. LC85 TaxID=1502851 RepID=UPI0004E30F4D|nr:ABC transporter permease [Bosea sp. LC85]KFC73878.1 ABC-type dipeptide/oligopeptide/nickel transport system, permease component [Bosea sp. LC85]